MDKLFKKERKIQEEIAAIDIGSDAVKLVVGTKSENKIVISHFGLRKLSSKAAEPALLANTLKELFKEGGIEEKKARKLKVHSVIPSSKVCVRAVKLPLIPKEEIPTAVKAKIKEFVSYPLYELVFDFSVLGETEEKGIKKLQVAFIAIQKKDFYKHLDVFKAVGVEPRLVTSSCFCGWNLVKFLDITETLPSFILISIGYVETDISVFRKGQLIFTRNIPFGSRNFIDALKNELNIKWEEAEDIVKKLGLSIDMLPAQYKVLPLQLKEILTRQAEIIFKEIDLTSHHYHQITHGEGIEKYFLYGGAGKIKGLPEFLSQRLDSPVEKLELPEERLEITADKKEELRENLPLYYQSLGALLASPDEINLVSFGRPKIHKGFPFAKISLAPNLSNILIFVFLALAIGIFVILKGLNIYYHTQIKYNKAVWANLQSRLNRITQFKSQLEFAEFKKKLYSQLMEAKVSYPEIMLQICESIPPEEIFLEELAFSKQADGKVMTTISGRITEKARISPSGFMLVLEKSGYFENLSLTTSARPLGSRGGITEEALYFTLRGQVRS